MSKPKWLEPLEQTGHFWMGFGARLVFLDYLLWRREAVNQWPPGDLMYAESGVLDTGDMEEAKARMADITWPVECLPLDRVQDMVTDMRWYTIGGTVADLLRAGLVLWWVL